MSKHLHHSRKLWYSIQCLLFVWAHHWLKLILYSPSQTSRHWCRLEHWHRAFIINMTSSAKVLIALLTFFSWTCFFSFPFTFKRCVPEDCVCFFFGSSLFVCCMNESGESTKNRKVQLFASGPGPWLRPGECSCSAVTTITCQWGKSNPPFWGSSTRSYCK